MPLNVRNNESNFPQKVLSYVSSVKYVLLADAESH
jgi:hypothetical protein